MFSSYSVLRGFDSQCGCIALFKHHFIYFISYDNVLCVFSCIFCYIYVCFLSYEINAVHCVSLTTVVQILAVSVLLLSSESVGTHCICANVYNAQHGHVRIQRGDRGPDPLENHMLYGFL